MMNEKDILRRHAMHAYELTDADRAEILAAFAADPAVCFEVAKEAASHRRDCFRAVWEHNPDALILDEVDLSLGKRIRYPARPMADYQQRRG